MKKQILHKYFNEKMKQIEIAKELNISKYKVSRIVSKDPRYKEEKNNRKELNKKKNIEETKKYIKEQRKQKTNDNSYYEMKQMHEQASRELSGGNKPISDRAFRNWNSSIYRYDRKSKSYILKKEIVTGTDAPKKIKWTNF